MIRRRSLAAALAWLPPMPRPNAASGAATTAATVIPRGVMDQLMADIRRVSVGGDAAWDAEMAQLRRNRGEGWRAARTGSAA